MSDHTAHQIRKDIREAASYGLNVYWRTTDISLAFHGKHAVRITRARTYCGQTQVYALGSGEWFTVLPGDAIYMQ